MSWQEISVVTQVRSLALEHPHAIGPAKKNLLLSFFFFFFLSFLGLNVQHMEVPWLGVQLEL